MPRPLWQDPFAAQSIELLQAPARARAAAVEKIGEAQAHAAEQTGNANANAQLQSGAVWANGIQQAGGAIASIPGQIQQAQQASRAAAMQNLQMNQMQRQATAADRLDETKQQLSSMMQSPDIYGEDGTINVKTLLSKMGGPLPNGDVGPTRAPDAATVYGLIDPINESLLKARASANVASQHRNDVVGRMADTILQFAGSNPDSLLDNVKLGTGALIKAGIITPNQADEILGPMIANPESIPAILGHLKTLGTPTKPIVGKPGEVFFDENTRQPIPGMSVPEKPEKPTEASLAADLSSPDPVVRARATTAIDALGRETSVAAQAETVRHNQEMERISSMTAGREVAAQQETARHNKATEAAANPLAALTGQSPSASGAPTNVTGQDFLKTLPPNIASEVKAYAEGRRPFPGGMAMKSPYFQSLIQMVGQYDSGFDAVDYNARSKTRNDFTSGKSAQTINALNTVAQHLDRLSSAADELNNSWSPTYNSIANYLSQKSGSSVVTKFETDKKAVVDELTRAWRQSGGTEGDIKSWSQVLDASNSPTQLKTAISEMGGLLEGKLSALEQQQKVGLGTAADIPIVTPQARAVLTRIQGGSAPASSGSVKILSITPKKP